MRASACAGVGAVLAACAPEQSVRDLCDEGLCAPGTLTWAVRAESVLESTVDAVAITPDEPPWFAGRWQQDLVVAERTTEHLGGWDQSLGADAFLARTGVRRLDTLSAAMNASYSLNVVGVVPDPEDGAMLFAIGQQEDQRHRLEVGWFDRSGVQIDDDPGQDGAQRHTIAMLDIAGTRGAAVTVDDRGWPIMAVSGTRIEVPRTLPTNELERFDGTRALVIRLGQGFEPELGVETQPTPLANLAGVDIVDIAVAGDVVAIGGTYMGAPTLPAGSAPWPACVDAMPCGFVAAFELGTGLFLWVQPVRASGGAVVHAVGVGGGQVVAMAGAVGIPAEPNLGVADVPLYLITLDAAGNGGTPAVVDQTIIATNTTERPTVIWGGDLAVTPRGEVLVAFSYRGTVTLDRERVFTDFLEDAEYAGVVAELGTDLLWKWSYGLEAEGDAGDGTTRLSSIAVRDDQVAVGGSFRGALELGVAIDVAQLTPSQYLNGVAIEFHR